jgi:acetylglutamate kinase
MKKRLLKDGIEVPAIKKCSWDTPAFRLVDNNMARHIAEAYRASEMIHLNNSAGVISKKDYTRIKRKIDRRYKKIHGGY